MSISVATMTTADLADSSGGHRRGGIDPLTSSQARPAFNYSSKGQGTQVLTRQYSAAQTAYQGSTHVHELISASQIRQTR